MKILHVAASLSHEWGGPIPVVKGLTEMMARKGAKVTILVPVKRGSSDWLVQPKGTEVRLFDQDFLSKIWTAHSFALARALRQEASRADLIHIHEIWHHPHFAAYKAARRAGRSYIVTIHGALAPWCLNYKALKKKVYTSLTQRRILNEAAAIHAITEEEVEHIRAFGVRTPVTVIPNGIAPEEFHRLPAREEFKKLYPEVEGKKVVLFLGRFHPIKGLDILAKAFGKIVNGREDVYLVIAGPDSKGYRAQVERMLESEGVIGKTAFTGMLTGKKKLAALSRADVFVLPSYSEGFSMAILEAMVCGLPVIITRQCNFPQVVEAKAGIVIDPNADQLAEALIKLLDNPKLREEMGANGRRLVIDNFTWDRVADQMIQLYEDVVGEK